jgi:MEDS: MEthanogen/methylotroph, DcmR Sensory domain
MEGMIRHQCLIYEGSPAKHLRGVAQLVRENLKVNKRCLYLNSPPMVAGMRSYLAAAGLDVAQEVSSGSLVLSSDASHLVNGRFDVDRMLGMLADAVNEAVVEGYTGLWATGDMTWEFGSEKNFGKLLEYECGLEEMFGSHPALSGVCQYHQDTLPDNALHVALSRHRALYVNETLSRINPFYSPIGSSTAPQPAPRLREMLNQLRRPNDM